LPLGPGNLHLAKRGDAFAPRAADNWRGAARTGSALQDRPEVLRQGGPMSLGNERAGGLVRTQPLETPVCLGSVAAGHGSDGRSRQHGVAFCTVRSTSMGWAPHRLSALAEVWRSPGLLRYPLGRGSRLRGASCQRLFRCTGRVSREGACSGSYEHGMLGQLPRDGAAMWRRARCAQSCIALAVAAEAPGCVENIDAAPTPGSPVGGEARSGDRSRESPRR